MNKKTVLVIEDNALNMKLVRTLLLLGRYHVLEAEDAETGLRLLRDHRPDLILMDIQLPGMDGLTATGIIKNDPELKGIPVVATTSYAMEGDEQRALKGRCDGYISKPVETRTFLDTIGKFIKGDMTEKSHPDGTTTLPHTIVPVDDGPMDVTLPSLQLPDDKTVTPDEGVSFNESDLDSVITDGLTGLYTHPYFQKILDMEIKRSRRRQSPFGLVLIELAGFKAVKDTAARPSEDHMLRETGRILKENIREVDSAARYDSGQFAVVLPDTDEQGVAVVVERLRRAISAQAVPVNSFPSRRITARFGIACYPDDGQAMGDLIKRANIMLLNAKTKEA